MRCASHSRFYLDLQNESWNLTSSLVPGTFNPAGVNLEKATAGMEIQSIASGRWNWSMGAIYSYRRMRNPVGLPAGAQPFFANGSNVALQGNVQRTLVRYAERRFTVDAKVSGETGTLFSAPLGRYSKLEGDLESRWYPRARGDDYETRARLRSGKIFGDVQGGIRFSAQ